MIAVLECIRSLYIFSDTFFDWINDGIKTYRYIEMPQSVVCFYRFEQPRKKLGVVKLTTQYDEIMNKTGSFRKYP